MSSPYSHLRILFINTFAILHKAFALNLYRLHAELLDVNVVVNASKQEAWLRELFIWLISSLILARFFLCFVGIVAHIIAMFPLLTSTQGELLLPTIIVNAIDNVILNVYELLLAYISLHYLQPQSMAVFTIVATKLTIRTAFSISTINAYSELHHLMTGLHEDETSLSCDSSQEFEIANEQLS